MPASLMFPLGHGGHQITLRIVVCHLPTWLQATQRATREVHVYAYPPMPLSEPGTEVSHQMSEADEGPSRISHLRMIHTRPHTLTLPGHLHRDDTLIHDDAARTNPTQMPMSALVFLHGVMAGPMFHLIAVRR